jgi:hypothetical protein
MTLEEGKGIHGKQKQNVTPTNKNYKKKTKTKKYCYLHRLSKFCLY